MASPAGPRHWLVEPEDSLSAGTQFTCFTGTKVQILTNRTASRPVSPRRVASPIEIFARVISTPTPRSAISTNNKGGASSLPLPPSGSRSCGGVSLSGGATSPIESRSAISINNVVVAGKNMAVMHTRMCEYLA